ncbi:NTP transferase domain-containing protein [Thermocrispum sp.]|jgi:molybdopterin-guanine dinucleotide biosynthesis protein A|uniref:Molybdopterin-guanine dinucleotide biosynthesis protein MobA n=1 Tax=Thermocrispum agreste TaxID=37925 RepID=A0A2W4LA31_9PSEU|nr:NTP transferase domain-containing protein [Thermocrispum sp.]PZM92526.1 MAG: molybdopterin-guanine dinucleotide biosynthesis protein MobA [Thermocrispum agreste]
MADRPLHAVILAGGAARRMSGTDKLMLQVGGRTLLEHVVASVRAAAEIVVVGPQRPAVPDVRWTSEEPAGGGPVAGLAAGLAALPRPAGAHVAVLAADLPGLRADTIERLRAALDANEHADGAVLVDESGRRQWLTGVWHGSALLAAVPGDPAGRSVRATLGPLRVVDVAARAGEAADVDTPDDLIRLRRR